MLGLIMWAIKRENSRKGNWGQEGVRYQVSGAGREAPNSEAASAENMRFLHSDSRLLIPHSCSSNVKVTPGIFMKTKEGKNAGVRYQVSAEKPEGRSSEHRRCVLLRNSDSRLMIPHSCSSNVKVTPGIFMKTKEGEEEGVRYQVSRVSGEARSQKQQSPKLCSTPTFRLPTPGSSLLLFKYEGDCGDIHENKGREKRRCQVSGVRCQRRS